jgi:hypothetical protein
LRGGPRFFGVLRKGFGRMIIVHVYKPPSCMAKFPYIWEIYHMIRPLKTRELQFTNYGK